MKDNGRNINQLHKLERESIQRRKEVQQLQQEYEYNMRKLEKLEQFMHIREKVDFKKYSEIDAQILIIQEFLWFCEVQTEFPDMAKEMLETPEVRNSMLVSLEITEQNEGFQMCLPGFKDKLSVKPKKSKVNTMELVAKNFVVGKNAVQMKNVLSRHNKKTLKDLLLYIAVEEKKGGKIGQMAEQLAGYICNNPQHVLPALNKQGVELLLQIAESKEDDLLMIDADNCDDYCQLIILGLLSMDIYCEQQQHIIKLSIPTDVLNEVVPFFDRLVKEDVVGKELAGYFEKDCVYSLEKLCFFYESCQDKLMGALTAYGAIDEESLFEVFCRFADLHCTYEEFRRLVYELGTLSCMWTTGKNEITKKRYVGINGELMGEVILGLDEMIEEYYQYDSYTSLFDSMEEDVHKMTEMGVILEQWDLSEDELLEQVFSYFAMVNKGDNIPKIMEEFIEEFCVEQELDVARFWKALVEIALYEKVYTLKGFNRMEAEKRFGRWRYKALFGEGNAKKILKVSIHNLPIKMQELLADIVLLAREGKLSEIFVKEKELDGLSHANIQIEAVLLLCMVDAYKVSEPNEKKVWKEQILERLKCWKKAVRDEEQAECIEEYFADRGLAVNVQAKRQNAVFIGDEETDEYGWCDWEEKEQPIHKASKVYPNDPCPCGSGKKYKKCCGR